MTDEQIIDQAKRGLPDPVMETYAEHRVTLLGRLLSFYKHKYAEGVYFWKFNKFIKPRV